MSKSKQPDCEDCRIASRSLHSQPCLASGRKRYTRKDLWHEQSMPMSPWEPAECTLDPAPPSKVAHKAGRGTLLMESSIFVQLKRAQPGRDSEEHNNVLLGWLSEAKVTRKCQNCHARQWKMGIKAHEFRGQKAYSSALLSERVQVTPHSPMASGVHGARWVPVAPSTPV